MSEIGKVYFDISQRVQYIFEFHLKYTQYNNSQEPQTYITNASVLKRIYKKWAGSQGLPMNIPVNYLIPSFLRIFLGIAFL